MPSGVHPIQMLLDSGASSLFCPVLLELGGVGHSIEDSVGTITASYTDLHPAWLWTPRGRG